jgi:RNA recognition motif-containing protein
MDTVGPKADLATTLFLGDLSILCDEVKLYGLFCRFGVIESVQLKKSDRDPQRAHLGFGFIKFAIRDCAAKAIQEMNGYFFLGRAMRVGWALDYGKKGYQWLMETVSDPKKGQTAQIHVMFVTRELNRRVSELDIGAVFGRYGNLVDVAIKKNAINHVRLFSSNFFKYRSHFLSLTGVWRAVRICFPSLCFDT